MKFLKIKLLAIAILLFAASSSFAGLSYDVTVNTTSLSGTNGFLYFQYTPISALDSTATVSNYSGGTLAGARSAEVDGSAVMGLLPGTVTFANTYGTNDYNQGITFGNTIHFNLTLDAPVFDSSSGFGTFSLGLFGGEDGSNPFFNASGINNTAPGTLFTVDLHNDGTGFTQVLAGQATVSSVPIPAAVWLLGSGLMGLIGIRRRSRA